MSETEKRQRWRYQYRSIKASERFQEFEGWSNKDYIDHILELRKEIIELEDQKKVRIEEKENLNIKLLSEVDFVPDWSYPTKIAFFLLLRQKPLTSEELHSELIKYDKTYSTYLNPKATLSVYLTNAAKRGRIKKIKIPGLKKLYFVLPEWVDSNGCLLMDFQISTYELYSKK